MMTDDFLTLSNFIREANVSNSTTDKINVLRKYKDNEFIKKILHYTYTPFKQFRITSVNCKKKANLVEKINNYNASIFNLLDDLHDRVITGNSAIMAFNAFVKDNSEYADILFNIIDKNLKTRIDTTLINKVIPGLVPVFDVTLAHTYDDSTKKKINWNIGQYVSRKLDGNRCVILVYPDGSIEAKTRNGKDYTTLQRVIDEIALLNVHSVVFDGEICLINQDGSENFQGIQSEIRKKDYTIPNPKFKIFDIIELDDFSAGYGNVKFSKRQDSLKEILTGYTGSTLELVEQVCISTQDELLEWSEKACVNGWEGVMLRADLGYKSGRTYDLLKVKKFKDAEYTVDDVEFGPFRVIVDGVEVEEQVLRNIFITHKSYRVSVGSGFSLEERRYYYQHPKELIGKEVTIQYFEETTNMNGGISLRFPTVKFIWKNGKRSDVE